MSFSDPDLPSPSRGRARSRSGSRCRPRSRSRSRQSTSSSAPTLSPGFASGVPHIHLSPASRKPRQLAHLTYDLLAAPVPAPPPSQATLGLCRQWRYGQYKPALHQTHHCGTALGWASEYASADNSAAAEPYMDKAWRQRWTSVAPLAPAGVAQPAVSLLLLQGASAPRPDFTYGFTGSAFSAAQRAVVDALPAATRVLERGREPLFPFFFQAWVDDGGSRREAEVEMARAGRAAGRALREFYGACGVEVVDVADTVVFSAVVSPEVCRVFVHWVGQAPGSGRVEYEVDNMCMALMEDVNGVENLRGVFRRLKMWARDVRLKRLKEVVDYAEELSLRANLREMEVAYEESMGGLKTARLRRDTASNDSHASEENGEVGVANTVTAERKDSVTTPDMAEADKMEDTKRNVEEDGVQVDTPRLRPQSIMMPPPSMSLDDLP